MDAVSLALPFKQFVVYTLKDIASILPQYCTVHPQKCIPKTETELNKERVKGLGFAFRQSSYIISIGTAIRVARLVIHIAWLATWIAELSLQVLLDRVSYLLVLFCWILFGLYGLLRSLLTYWMWMC